MSEYPLSTSFLGTVKADGTAKVTFGPQMAGESWETSAITCTSTINGTSASSITVSQYGQVVDSTAFDIRPNVTTDTVYTIPTGGTIVVQWAGLPVGAQVVVTVTGTKYVGGKNRGTG